MKIILLGPPGAGKGTLARLLSNHDGSVQISTGEIFRSAISEGSFLGKKIEESMKSGNLVPDQDVMDIMEQRLRQHDCKNGYLLDGFPRTLPQAQALEKLLAKLDEELDCVVELDVPRATIIERLTTRRTCTNCGEIYNVKFKPSKVEGVCDVCGSSIVQRDDETEEAILNRLEVYQAQTAPLVDFYRESGLLLSLQSDNNQEIVEKVVSAVTT
jgi:adenylate kinase